jgi:hypothetical protein
MPNMPSQMISAYFEQAEQYFSESKGAFLQVREMHQTHAANAAARMVDDAYRWANEAGASDVKLPRVWMIRQPLFLALVTRANQL